MSLANAFTNAISNLAGAASDAIGGVFTGANSITQPQFGSIFNTSIPATPLISTRDYFLFQLQSWITTFPLNSQWIALVESYPSALNTSIIQGLERGSGNKNAYDINAAKTLLTSAPFQRVSGCLFCNYCQLPPESFGISTASVPNNRGFIPGVVAGPRKSYADSPLTLGFFETNTSFIDNVIRPWVMLASHYGLVAREGDTPSSRSAFNVKTTIYLLYYTRTYQAISQVPRKVFKFYNCVPYQVSNQEYTYEEASTVKSYNVNFTYSNYTVENNLFLPLPTIVNAVRTGGGGVATLPAVT